MNVIKFQELDKEQKQSIVYCILDKSPAQEIIKNIADWTIQNLTIEGYTVLVSTDEDSLLITAANDYKYAVVLSTGTEFINSYSFHEEVEKFCSATDFFIAGHILDRKDFYYELHDQCYIINLEYYKRLDTPIIGTLQYHSPHEQIEPIRSSENIHDDYTPIYVRPGTNTKHYFHKCHGWNLLRLAFENQLPVVVFDHRFRDNKKHYYPEYPEVYNKEINFVHCREAFCSGLAVYPFNSEGSNGYAIEQTFEQLVTPASGLNWIFYITNYKFSENAVVKFYDYSLPTLELLREIVEWNGDDYTGLVRNFLDRKFKFLNQTFPYCGPQDLEREWQLLQSQHNWPVMWERVKRLKFEFHWINLLDSTKDLSWIESNVPTLFNTSNIFNYIGTASNYSVRTRVDAENVFLNNLRNHNPNTWVMFSRRAASGFINREELFPKAVTEIELTNIQDLTKPTWHYNQDWTI
jgi:hypothetical protein